MCKTLIAEDNPTFRKTLREILCSRFPTMDIAEEPDGSRVFSKIETFRPEIIFIDIHLPGENGLELTKKIKRSYPDIIVVILTNYDVLEYRQAAIRNNANYFITKDSSASDFLALVESICLSKKSDSSMRKEFS